MPLLGQKEGNMVCKKCQAEFSEDVTVCPVCGAEAEEECLQTPAEELPVENAECVAAPEEVSTETENRESAPVEDEPGEEEVPALEETEQEQPAKKSLSTRIVAIVCSIAIVLGLGIAVWGYGFGGFSGGFGEDDVMVKSCYAVDGETSVKTADTVIAKVGNKTLTNRQLQVIYWMEVMNFLQQNSYYLAYYGLDMTLPLSEQYVTEGGLTWEQYFMDNALSNWHYYQCLVLEAEKNGVVLSDSLKQNIDEMFTTLEYNALAYGYTSVDELMAHDMGTIANSDAYRAYVELYYGGMEYFASIYADINPTREEVENYYNVHGAEVEEKYGVSKESGPLVDVRHILVAVKTSGTDETGKKISTDEDWATCLSDAEQILAAWKEGAATEDSFALMANTFSEDPGSNTTGGLYTLVAQGQMVETFDAWCFDAARQPGDTGIVKTEFGYHIIYFVKGEAGWIRRSEQMLIEATCTEILAGYMEAYPLLVNYKNIVLSAFSLL